MLKITLRIFVTTTPKLYNVYFQSSAQSRIILSAYVQISIPTIIAAQLKISLLTHPTMNGENVLIGIIDKAVMIYRANFTNNMTSSFDSIFKICANDYENIASNFSIQTQQSPSPPDNITSAVYISIYQSNIKLNAYQILYCYKVVMPKTHSLVSRISLQRATCSNAQFRSQRLTNKYHNYQHLSTT